MQILTVGNLVAHGLQVALLVTVTATVLTLLRVRSPRVRYTAWRTLLFLVAVVPFVQPWHVTTTIVPATQAFLQVSVAPTASAFDAATAWGRTHLVPLAIVSGCALRLFWILAGVLRLRGRLVMWWLVDRVQFAREEVVDAAAIPIVGGRRTYVRALLTFADAPPPAALAPAFARRRHLFTRITRLYQESTMSTRQAAFTALLLRD